MNAGIDAPATSTFQQTRIDPSDAPPDSDGKTDLRSLTWDVGATTTTVTVVVDESVVGPVARSE